MSSCNNRNKTLLDLFSSFPHQLSRTFKAGKYLWGEYVFFAGGTEKFAFCKAIHFFNNKHTVCMGILYICHRQLHPAPAVLYVFPAPSCVHVEREHTSSGGEKKKKINKSSSQYSQDRLRLCVCFFFYIGLVLYSARAVIFSFFFVNDEYLVLWNEAHSFPPPVIGVSQEQTLICAFQQSGPPLSIHL